MADSNSLQDDELYLPRTVVNKLIKEIVPNIRVSTDARDLLLNCCTEFIHLLASEASDISEKQQKKVISPEHVMEALTTLGFQEYVPDVKAVHKEYKEQASKHRKRGKSKLDKLGIPEEELARQQQQLFDEARQQQMESELLEQQQGQVSIPTASKTTGHSSTTITSGTTVPGTTIHETSLKSLAASGNSKPNAELESQEPPLQRKPSGTLPHNAAITVASLQATSNLLQQAIAMASAQMAATNNTQLQQSTQGLGELMPQNVLLPQPTLQAALAAQCMAAQAQSQSQLLSPAPSQPGIQGTQATASSETTLPSQEEMATPQELSVAQMMMTLARASNKNTLAQNGSGNTQDHAVDGNAK